MSADRRGDPGEEIWKELVVRYAVLGLVSEPRLKLAASNPRNGAGRAVPLSWDPQGVGRY